MHSLKAVPINVVSESFIRAQKEIEMLGIDVGGQSLTEREVSQTSPNFRITSLYVTSDGAADLPEQIHKIKFRNYYTASFAVYALVSDKSDMTDFENSTGDAKWKTIIPVTCLMPKPSCDKSSQDVFSFNLKEPVSNVMQFRFVLRQPSNFWKKFTLKDIEIFTEIPVASPTSLLKHVHSDGALSSRGRKSVEKQRQISNKLPLHEISQSLHNMWALTASLHLDDRACINDHNYDVDGCYEINLLSYDCNGL